MEIMVEFILLADNFPVDEVIEKIGIPCSEKLIKDEIRYIGPDKNIPRINETSSITYSTGYVKTSEVQIALDIMYNMLNKNQNQLIELIEKYNLYTKFCIVINLTNNPIIGLSNKFINLASKLNAEIEFDTYLD